MKYKISDLMDHVEDIGMCCNDEYNTSAISSETIKEKTMDKINKNRKRRRMTPRRMFLIAAAVMIMSATAVTATAAVINQLNVRKMESGEVLRGNGYSYTAEGNESVININPKPEGYATCFKPSWLPEDAGCMDKVPFKYYINDFAQDTGKATDEVWETSGMMHDEAEIFYTTMWNNPEGTQMSDGRKGSGRFFRIDLFDGTTIAGKDLVVQGDLSIIKEGEINGMSATYMTESKSKDPDTAYIQNYIVLFSEEYNCLVKIVGDMEFDELEKIAEGLELKQTGIKSRKSSGGYSLFGGGLG